MMKFLSAELFPTIINMSITASMVILLVLAARLLLRKAPKLFSYTLWAVVLFRLLCPVSVPADLSLLSLLDTPAATATEHTTTVSYLPQNTAVVTIPQVPTVDNSGVVSGISSPGAPQSIPAPIPTEEPLSLSAAAAAIWLAGIACMIGYSLVSFLRLHRRLVGAALLQSNIYLADHIDSPFVMGLFRARIYLPSSLSTQEQGYILLHEQHHIRRMDHIIKALAFLALCIHWFNPLVWIAFVLSSKDMEMSCDEAVMRQLGEDIRSDYSASLLSLATGRRIIAGTPLAFGEGDTRSRIKNVLNWKRPKAWIAFLAALVCILVIAACAGNPADNTPDSITSDSGTPEDIVPAPECTSMEDYVRHRIEQMKTVSYYSAATQDEITVSVLDAKIGWLEKRGEVFGLAPNGTLEAWSYNILVKPDAETEDIMLVGGQYEEDGYFDLEGQGGRIAVALRDTNGNYDVLYDAVINDGLDFFGYCNTTEEAIHDWYVKKYGLDLPLYSKDWIDCITIPEDGSLGNVPVHRYDGDCWYLYIPVSAWTQTEATENRWQWASLYWTGSTLTVDHFDHSLESLFMDHRKQGFTPTDETNRIWSRVSGGVTSYYYCFEAPDGSTLRVTIQWTDAGITDYPYIAMEPEILRLMAESFCVTVPQEPDTSSLQMENALRTLISDYQHRFEQGAEPLSFLRVDENRERALTVEGNMLSVLSAAADKLEKTDDPVSFRALGGGICIVLDSADYRHISFFAGETPGSVLLRYVGEDINESAIVNDPQLYLYIIASAERENVQLHDLDSDGFFEAILWNYNENDLVIHDFFDNTFRRFSVNGTLGCDASDYAGLIANIAPDYDTLVQVADFNGSVSLYRYCNGEFIYVCPMNEALR